MQHGFRKKHGCGHRLRSVSEEISDKLSRGHTSAMLLLNVQQAYDRVWHVRLILKLTPLGYPPSLIKLIQSYFSDREFKVRLGQSLLDPRRVLAGVPQGSVLFPILFNIFSHNIPTHLNVVNALYGDDIALLSSGLCITNSTTHMQKLPSIQSWYSTWRLQINEKNLMQSVSSNYD